MHVGVVGAVELATPSITDGAASARWRAESRNTRPGLLAKIGKLALEPPRIERRPALG